MYVQNLVQKFIVYKILQKDIKVKEYCKFYIKLNEIRKWETILLNHYFNNNKDFFLIILFSNEFIVF